MSPEDPVVDLYVVVVTRPDGIVLFGNSAATQAEALALKAQYDGEGHKVTITLRGKPLEGRSPKMRPL
jgi:hypothetical protein